MYLILDASTNRVFDRGRTDILECLDKTADCMSSVPDHRLKEGLVIDHNTALHDPFLDAIPDDGKVHVTNCSIFDR